jgi:hypothetical protein
VHIHAIGGSVAAAMRGEPYTAFPTWDKVRAAFDAALTAPPEGEEVDDTPNAIMLRALGLR